MSVREFSRPVSVTRLGGAGVDQAIEAREGECSAIAKRLRIPAVSSLGASFRVGPGSRSRLIEAEGTLAAKVVQTCVISGEDFAANVTADIRALFGDELPGAEPDPDSPWDDVEPVEDGVIDLGELAVQHLALALDPYPRKPGAVFVTSDDGAGQGTPFSQPDGLVTE